MAVLGVVLCALALGNPRAAELQLVFLAERPEYADAAQEYAAIWRDEGARIVAGLEQAAGVVLPQARIDVVVHEAASHSGSARAPMRLRASYAPGVKRGTLVHELGHRYLAALALPRSELSEHEKLDLLLVPVWTQLWGDRFVARQIAAESAWSDEYRRSWQWWSALQPDERTLRWRALLASSRAREVATRDSASRSDD